MGFRKKQVEMPIQQPRPKELSKPASEKQKFYQEHVDLDMDMREIRLLFALAEDGVDVASEIEAIANKVISTLVKQYGDDTEAMDTAKLHLLDRVLPASLDFSNPGSEYEKLQAKFFKQFLISGSVERHFREEVKEGKVEVQNVASFFEKLPTYQADLDQIVKTIKAATESKKVSSQNDSINTLINSYLQEIKSLHLEAELQSALFTHISEQVALAWGHNPLVVESMSKDYVLLHQLGYGANGEAYSAINSSGESVAMKILSPRNPETNERLETISKDAARQFQRELYVLEQVEHEHLVEYKDGAMIPVAKDSEGDIIHSGWVAMEFIDGPNLKEESDKRTPFQVQDAVDIIRQSLEGLAVLHKQGIIHRDIKPHNIMLDKSSGEVVAKLIDFGVAINPENPFEADKDSSDQGIYGSPLYMAPEIAGLGELSPKADVFSMGVILYELLTKQHPFIDKFSGKKLTLNSIIIDVSTNTPLPIDALRSGVSPELSRFVLRMIAKDPLQRPTAKEAITVLTRILSELPKADRAGANDLTETKSIPGYRKSELVGNSQYEATHSLTDLERQEQIATLEEIAKQVMQGYTLVSLTRKSLQLGVEELLGADIKDEDVTALLAYLKEEGIIRDNVSDREGYIVVKNYEKYLQEKINRGETEQQNEPERLYLKQGVDINFAQQYLSANNKGTITELQSSLSLSEEAALELLEDLQEQGFLRFSQERNSYSVSEQDQSKVHASDSSDIRFDDFDPFGDSGRELYLEQGVNLDFAKQFLSSNRSGDVVQLQSDLSLTFDATIQLLETLDREKFLSFDPNTYKYVVSLPEKKTIFSRIRKFFQ